MYTHGTISRQSSSVAAYLTVTGPLAATLLEKKTANSGYFPRYVTNDGVGGGHIFEGKCIFENKPPPQSRSCLLLKGGGAVIFGRIRYFKEGAITEVKQGNYMGALTIIGTT